MTILIGIGIFVVAYIAGFITAIMIEPECQCMQYGYHPNPDR